jgi:hypothetical protein
MPKLSASHDESELLSPDRQCHDAEYSDGKLLNRKHPDHEIAKKDRWAVETVVLGLASLTERGANEGRDRSGKELSKRDEPVPWRNLTGLRKFRLHDKRGVFGVCEMCPGPIQDLGIDGATLVSVLKRGAPDWPAFVRGNSWQCARLFDQDILPIL